MNRTITLLSLSLGASLVLGGGAAAQNLVISNARIIVGPGKTLEKGAIVIKVNINWVMKEQAREVAAAGAQVASITGFGSPDFNLFSHDNQPKVRERTPTPG